MKTIVAGIGLLVVLLSFTVPQRHFSKAKTLYREAGKDSGFVQKVEALKLLTQARYDLDYHPENDTLDINRPDLKPNDTIGKFYGLDNGNRIALLKDITHPNRWPTILLLIEYAPDGTVIQTEPYWAGNYLCCWKDGEWGFYRHDGGYFSIKTCETGSGFCAGDLQVFKGFAPQQNSRIYSNIWSRMCVYTAGPALACHLTSTMEIKNDTVTMHYTMEHLKERRNGKYKTVFSEKFDVKYVEREQGWAALDSTKIQDFPY